MELYTYMYPDLPLPHFTVTQITDHTTCPPCIRTLTHRANLGFSARPISSEKRVKFSPARFARRTARRPHREAHPS
eukprot:3519315-Prymnesium_polylepis.1